MPRRKEKFVNEEVYHVYSKSVAGQKIFRDKSEIGLFLELMNFYRYSQNFKFSIFRRMSAKRRKEYLINLYKAQENVFIHAFCIMPNHYHFLIEQRTESGITNYISLIQNSFSRHFNLKHNRFGRLFVSPFKAKRIESEEVLLHVCRYIHLNPYSAKLISSMEKLGETQITSHRIYLQNELKNFITKDLIMSHFSSVKNYQRFIEDRADYQRTLEEIKHHTPGV